MRWLIANYQPVSLFSLKHGEATSTGGKSLLVPTPFAIRTALLDAAIRVWGVAYGPQAFEAIKTLRLALRPPQRASVTNLFAKVLKPERDRTRGRAMQQTIAFREYVHLEGTLAVALGGESAHLEMVASLLPHISYLGKRGSFFQLLAPPEEVETADTQPPDGFTPLVAWNHIDDGTQTGPVTFPLGCIQRLDDWGPELTFERVNIYTGDKIRMDRERIRFDVVLPYRLVRSGRGFTVFQAFGGRA
jgi:hypothetical protein